MPLQETSIMLMESTLKQYKMLCMINLYMTMLAHYLWTAQFYSMIYLSHHCLEQSNRMISTSQLLLKELNL
jgi:hypothetical protein